MPQESSWCVSGDAVVVAEAVAVATWELLSLLPFSLLPSCSSLGDMQCKDLLCSNSVSDALCTFWM